VAVSDRNPTSPVPVEIFGAIAGQATFARYKDDIEKLRGGLRFEASAIVQYLSAGAIVLALMEQTTDVLEGAFKVLGGSAILTDGTYYWRRDTSAYVERYHVALPDPFLEHMRSLEWKCPAVGADRVSEIDHFLSKGPRE
jgi:hypothetical protein